MIAVAAYEVAYLPNQWTSDYVTDTSVLLHNGAFPAMSAVMTLFKFVIKQIKRSGI